MAFQTTGPDSPFARYAGVVPENYLRVLSFKESGFRPDVVHPKSHATGLFQITSTALNTFNQRNSTNVTLPQLVDPDLNTRVASQHLAGVINVYKRYRSLQPDWTSRRWLELLPLGWNGTLGKIGLAVYLVGTLVYFASWLPHLRMPVSNWSASAAGLLAPRLTPLIPLLGVALIARFWPYGMLAALFVFLHTWHGIQNLNKNQAEIS